jgi:aspartyl-tRNA(Asn)/glutamyl-tRNA(Gln) amidotransferase subunit A
LLTRFTSLFNLTGLPALSLPCGYTAEGLPIGLQMVARPWAETHLLQAACAYEEATQWHLRRPVIE